MDVSFVQELSDAAVAAQLTGLLGSKLTAILGGADDIAAVKSWIFESAPGDRRHNLIAALQATYIIVEVCGAAAAQRWFLASDV